MALRLDVTRHPFSFRGSQAPTPELLKTTWKWGDGLNVYAGDEIQQYLLSMDVPHREVKLLRSPGGLREVLNDPDNHRPALGALLRASMMRGNSVVWNQENLKAALDTIDPNELGKSRGREMSELDVIAGESYKEGLHSLGRSVDIDFDFNVSFCWYPVDSQRTLLYSYKFGAQEAFADAMARRHFTLSQASGDRETVLDAAEEVGLDPVEVEAMLEGDEFSDDVWKSYQDTTGKHKIYSIPFFVFNGPHSNGGKFRRNGENSGEKVVRGSGNVEQFLNVFERINNEMHL